MSKLIGIPLVAALLCACVGLIALAIEMMKSK